MEISCDGFRVKLKTLGIADAESIAENANDPEIAFYVSETFPHPYGRAEALSYIDLATKEMMDGLAVHFGIFVDGKGPFGTISLMDISTIKKSAELGYWLGKKYWGKGYIKEATELILAYGFEELELNRIHARTLSTNERSMKSLELVGFKKEGTLRESTVRKNEHADEVLWGILKKEFKASAKIKVVR